MLPQQYCLRWKYHHSNLQTMFSQLLDRGCFCDVTLACEGQTIRCHRVVLCACSTYFDALLTNVSTDKDPIIIMRDCKFKDIKCLIEFMYKGEINVEHENLASLLKTAEELRIKGLAEVSWRDDECSEGDSSRLNSSLPRVNASTPQVPDMMPILTTVPAHHRDELQMPNGVNTFPNKKKRGRPPLDEEYDNSFCSPKISHVTSIPEYTDSAHLVSVMMDENSKENNNSGNKDPDDSSPGVPEVPPDAMNLIPKLERPDTPEYSEYGHTEEDTKYDPLKSIFLTAQEREEWKDVIKMNDYLTKGRRPQFWEEPFTKRVMDAIKTKNLEMKKAAKLLGVSYGTLYGRYRETYGCLKSYRGSFAGNQSSVSMVQQWGSDLIPTGTDGFNDGGSNHSF